MTEDELLTALFETQAATEPQLPLGVDVVVGDEGGLVVVGDEGGLVVVGDEGGLVVVGADGGLVVVVGEVGGFVVGGDPVFPPSAFLICWSKRPFAGYPDRERSASFLTIPDRTKN